MPQYLRKSGFLGVGAGTPKASTASGRFSAPQTTHNHHPFSTPQTTQPTNRNARPQYLYKSGFLGVGVWGRGLLSPERNPSPENPVPGLPLPVYLISFSNVSLL